MRGTGTEQVVVVEKDRNWPGTKGLPHRAGAGAATALVATPTGGPCRQRQSRFPSANGSYGKPTGR